MKDLQDLKGHKKKTTILEERRFTGLLANELKNTRLAYPDFDIFQDKIGEVIAGYNPLNPTGKISVLEIGCGYGFTADIILNSRPDIELHTIDNEPSIISQAREYLDRWKAKKTFSIIEADALSFLKKTQESSFDIVASVLTIHNFKSNYRNKVLNELPRILKPGGIFVNADKYALKGRARYKALAIEIERYFNAFIPLGKYDLLKEWVLHHISDNTPERLMYEVSSIKQFKSISFKEVEIVYRGNMVAVLVAKKIPASDK